LALSGEGWSGTTTLDSDAVAPELASPEADQVVVTPDYFRSNVFLALGFGFFAKNERTFAKRV
jgi:hypothetical protein